MKIESDLLKISMPQSNRVQDPSKPDGQSSSRAASLTSTNDAVDLGSQAGLAAAAQNAGQEDRANVVQTLRALIQSGQYQVDSSALSAAIVTSAQTGY
jgi:anti-sigma28 factor (negative regulator of flagellin synthesis)